MAAAAAVETTPAVTAAAARAPADAIVNNDRVDRFFVSDGLLHGLIGFFSVVVIALLRQASSLVDELYSLGGEFGHYGEE